MKYIGVNERSLWIVFSGGRSCMEYDKRSSVVPPVSFSFDDSIRFTGFNKSAWLYIILTGGGAFMEFESWSARALPARTIKNSPSAA